MVFQRRAIKKGGERKRKRRKKKEEKRGGRERKDQIFISLFGPAGPAISPKKYKGKKWREAV